MPVRNPESSEQERPVPGGAWRSQSPWLKVMLAVSLVFVAVGVYRCSAELVPPDGPRTIRVERATIAVPDSLLAVSVDSFAVLATRMFARGLRGASTAEVTVGEDPATWAVVRLHMKSLPEGRIELTGTASSVVGGGRMAAVSVSDSPDRLREMVDAATSDIARELGVEEDSPVEER
ncbi:MAG: hypothetical protein ABIK85_01780 [Candidatus Eisenbacteria bacterium]